MQYVLKVNLSVGIVAMVKIPKENSTDDGSGSSNAENEEEGEFDWSMEIQGHVLAAYYYGYVATQFLGGYAAGRWGGRYVVGPGVSLTGVFTLLCPVAARRGGPWALFVLRVLQGLCSGVILPGMHVMFSLWFPAEERLSFSGAIFSGIYGGTVVGMAASGPLSKWPLEGGGWPMVFYFLGAIGAFLIIPWWLLCYSNPKEHPRISKQEKDYILSALGNENDFRVTSLGPSICMIAITQVGYNPNTIVALLIVNGVLIAFFFGGSYVNHLDLAVNYAGPIAGILHTLLNSSGIFIPLIIAAIVEESRSMVRWSIAFYLVSAISVLTYLMYVIFGSVEERPWNKVEFIKEEKEQRVTTICMAD
ncbi:hypothetical protein J437_LFUL005404 [Ladona fulva]|uniref:Major facilitator superfamily (MFS) profile domain-containing protein n=1 Tax=Ladona fulva TaxID=123851 RepID=A0A8K0K117_LADFU|nr:hypothetical protein J437_LFUL005404 [Ladona fulva]